MTEPTVTAVDPTRCVAVSGVAGSVATVLHDAVMNPAEGKKIILNRITDEKTIHGQAISLTWQNILETFSW